MQLDNNVSKSQKQKQSYANDRRGDKEQFYTNSEVANKCVDYALGFLNSRGISVPIVLEPCGGTGEFVKAIKSNNIQVISCDIDPKHPDVVRANFVDNEQFGPAEDPVFKNGRKLSSYSDLVCITNPPFGRNSSLSIPFFKRCTQTCNYICQIVPRSWRKGSIINRIPSEFWLVADIDLPTDSFYYPDGSRSEKGVLQTVFQIWEKRDVPRPKVEEPDHGLIKKIQPTKRKVQTYKKEKRNIYIKNGNQFVPVMETYYLKKDIQSRPIYVAGANFSIVYAGSTAGQTSRISQRVIDADTKTYYFHVEDPKVVLALESIDYKKMTGDNAYVESFSLDDINRELNKIFGLETQDLSWLENVIGS